MVNRKTLVLLLGPTGVGKTELSLRVAEHYGCPILNCDSRQVFRGIPIGTAAPTAQELADLRTVISEAVTNAIVHGYRGTTGDVSVCLRMLRNRLRTVSAAALPHIRPRCPGSFR